MNGVIDDTRRPGISGHKAGNRWRALFVICAVVLGIGAAVTVMTAEPLTAQVDEFPPPRDAGNDKPPPPTPDANVVDVRVEGNTTIPADAIAKFIKTRAGQPPSQAQIREDVCALYATHWFFSVEPRYRAVDQGTVIIFRVLERPVVQNVEYRGNDKIKTKHLAARTGLKKKSPFDVSANRESARRIEEYYHEKGYTFATVKLTKGGHKEDREVIFEIEEGPKVRVTKIKFTGNEEVSGPVLKTKVRTKTAVLWYIGGLYKPDTIPDDIAALRQYYHNLGYFDIEIDHDIVFNKDRSRATFEYIISEGPRYKVRNVEFLGNNIFSSEELRQDLELAEGEAFNMRFLSKDIANVKDRYGKLGRLFASVDAVPRFLEEPGVADLVYRIDEDKVYRVRRVDVVINGENPHTKRAVVLNSSLIHPGGLADPKMIERSKTRVSGIGIFERGPQNGVTVDIRRVAKIDDPARNGVVRGQNQERALFGVGHTSFDTDGQAISASPAASSPRQQPTPVPTPTTTTDSYKRIRPVTPWMAPTIRGQSFDDPGPLARPGFPYFGNNPQGNPLLDPLYEPMSEEEVDLIFRATEARTGRLMFGVGVNSDAGVVGSIVLSEQNFNILRPPTSFRDILDGSAWRGGGQRFRAEAVPGNVVSRYLVSWTDPYFLDTNYSLGVSGFFYDRFFPDWDESRAGGRISLGRQFTPQISVTGALRLENVEITNPDIPTPASLAASLGESFLSTFRTTFTHDTRDSAFMPGEGHKVDLSYEQAFGDFDYARFEVEGRQYYTVRCRPDGGGRHIIAVGGQIGWTEDTTPIFERFFAGGFQTFRGFEFRGLGPREQGVAVGGNWMAIGSVEYMFPLMANETIQLVTFSDFGTVEPDTGFDAFRLSAGAGLRITIPAMGPVPLAFDWAVPLIREDGDETRIFSFYVGITR
jgi:outer membrane protein insertion porin family